MAFEKCLSSWMRPGSYRGVGFHGSSHQMALPGPASSHGKLVLEKTETVLERWMSMANGCDDCASPFSP